MIRNAQTMGLIIVVQKCPSVNGININVFLKNNEKLIFFLFI